ncbi:AMP-binding protein [Colwelliaceae bacterium 6441]
MESYEELYNNFVWERPETFNFATDVIDKHASKNPNNQAMLWVDDAGNECGRSFADISKVSKQAANMLKSAGVKKGDAVILVLGRQKAWWEMTTACIRGGYVFSAGTVQLSPKDISYRINASAATAIVTDAANAHKVDEIIDQCPSIKARIVVDGARENWIDYDATVGDLSDEFTAAETKLSDDMLCFFTSGTTGYPKMVVHSQSYSLGHRVTGQYWLDLKSDDLHWNISDTGWAKAAWSSYFGPWTIGACVFVHHASGFDPIRNLDLLQQYPITTMCGAPTIYRMLVQQDLTKYSFPHLRHSVGAGEPLNPEVISTWQDATGVTIRDGYGQSESIILCGSFPSIEVRPGSMGKPAPGVNLNIIDNEGQIVAVNEEGNIAVNLKPYPPMGLFKGYTLADEKNQEAFQGDWYLTGDRGYKDEDGYFWFVGRSDDVILSSGYRIGPFEVESALLEHAAVAESAVVASPDEERGEVVKAFIVLAAGYKASDELLKEIQNHVKRVTAPYKYPRKIAFVESLPKTVSGKIRRIELREQEHND